jgi:hypothetical protein
MRGHYTHGAHGQNMLRSRLFPSHIRHGVPRIFLTAPLSSAAVGFHQDQGEQLRRYGKLATSSEDPLVAAIIDRGKNAEGRTVKIFERTILSKLTVPP